LMRESMSSIEAIVLAGEWAAQEKIATECTGSRRINVKLATDENG
jgi:hypothetical protein